MNNAQHFAPGFILLECLLALLLLAGLLHWFFSLTRQGIVDLLFEEQKLSAHRALVAASAISDVAVGQQITLGHPYVDTPIQIHCRSLQTQKACTLEAKIPARPRQSVDPLTWVLMYRAERSAHNPDAP